MKALVWPIATYGCESWTFRKNEETRLDAFEMKGLRKILRVSSTAVVSSCWFSITLHKWLHTPMPIGYFSTNLHN